MRKSYDPARDSNKLASLPGPSELHLASKFGLAAP
jgi:hypothetical protein